VPIFNCITFLSTQRYVYNFAILESIAAFLMPTLSMNCSVLCQMKLSDDTALFLSEYYTSVKSGSGTFGVLKGRSSLTSHYSVSGPMLKIVYSEITASSRPCSFSDILRTSIYGRAAYPKDRFRVACSGQPSLA